MTFAEMFAEITSITGRPDLITDTQIAIRKATLKMHSIDFFPRDRVELALVVSPASYIAQVSVSTQLPRFRAAEYIREAIAGSTKERYMKRISPDAMFDEWNIERSDIYYQAGDILNIKSLTLLNGLRIGYFANPVIGTGAGVGYVSWIAAEFPYAIIDDAAATIFKMIGQDAMEAKYRAASNENAGLLRQNYLIESAFGG